MILHGIDAPNILHTNTLTENLAEFEEKDRVDVVMANPPFGGKERKDHQTARVLSCRPAAYRSEVDQLDGLLENGQRLAALCQKKLDALDQLKKSLLHQAFSGNL
jgi:hypothetical protein